MRAMNKIIMTLAGLLLIFAAVLKFHEMIDTCVPSWDAKAHAAVIAAEKEGVQLPQWKATMFGIWESYEFNLFQIPLEFALGVWMVCGLFRKAAWIAGTLAFFGFIFVTIGKWVTGAESCGCFGQIHVDPRITLFTMDIPIFLLLAIFRPRGYKLLPPPWPNLFWLLGVFVPTIGLMVTAPPAMVALRPDCKKAAQDQPDPSAKLKLEIYQLQQQFELTLKQQQRLIDSLQKQLTQQQTTQQVPPETNSVDPAIDSDQQIIEPNQTEQGEPDTLPDVKLWEWLEYVVEEDVRQQLTEELVIVMMNRYDCSVCEEMAPRYSDYYQQMVDQDAVDFKIAFLSIPPYGEADHVPDDTACIVGKLTDQEKWELMSPYVVALLNGELIKSWQQGTAPEPENILDQVFE